MLFDSTLNLPSPYIHLLHSDGIAGTLKLEQYTPFPLPHLDYNVTGLLPQDRILEHIAHREIPQLALLLRPGHRSLRITVKINENKSVKKLISLLFLSRQISRQISRKAHQDIEHHLLMSKPDHPLHLPLRRTFLDPAGSNLFCQLVNRCFQLRIINRLQNIILHPMLQSKPSIFKLLITGQHDDLCLISPLANFPQKLQSVHQRHSNITQNDIRLKFHDQLDAFHTVSSCSYKIDLKLIPRNSILQMIEYKRLVIYKQRLNIQ
ncbi:hypothetical protein D3C77_412870 [compost metagenome]